MEFSSQEEAQTLEGWLVGRIHPEDRPNVHARADESIDQRKEFEVTKPTNVQDENVLTPTAFNRCWNLLSDQLQAQPATSQASRAKPS